MSNSYPSLLCQIVPLFAGTIKIIAFLYFFNYADHNENIKKNFSDQIQSRGI